MLVLVTRAAEDGERTAAALARSGHAAVPAPVIRIAPRPIRWPAARPKALIATSYHAVPAAFPPGWAPALPVFAVGHRTAEAARAAGFKDVRIGAGGGENLVPLVGLTLPRPGPLLYVAGRDRKPELEAMLDAAGYRVEVIETYAAEPADAWPAAACDALREGRVEAALHYSHRSAGLALQLARTSDALDPFLALRHLCLSADAAEPLVSARASSVAVAERPDEPNLLALLPRP